MELKTNIIIVISLLMCISQSFASPVFNPENGHYYELVVMDSVYWTSAKNLSEQMMHEGYQGHLVTITSEEENTWIKENLGDSGALDNKWIGGFYVDENPIWQWVTGEA